MIATVANAIVAFILYGAIEVTLYVGIDPGESGSVVAIDDDGKIHSTCANSSHKELNAYFISLQNHHTLILIEDVHSFPSDSKKAVFSFGTSYGRVSQASLLSYAWRTDKVSPVTWQKYFQLSMSTADQIAKYGKKETKTQKKNRHKEYAISRSGQKLVHKYCDAYLIALYLYETSKNDSKRS